MVWAADLGGGGGGGGGTGANSTSKGGSWLLEEEENSWVKDVARWECMRPNEVNALCTTSALARLALLVEHGKSAWSLRACICAGVAGSSAGLG